MRTPKLLTLTRTLSGINRIGIITPGGRRDNYDDTLDVSRPLCARRLPSKFVTIGNSPTSYICLTLRRLCRSAHFSYIVANVGSKTGLKRSMFFSNAFNTTLATRLFNLPTVTASLMKTEVGNSRRSRTRHCRVTTSRVIGLLARASVMRTFGDLPCRMLGIGVPSMGSTSSVGNQGVAYLKRDRVTQPMRRIMSQSPGDL